MQETEETIEQGESVKSGLIDVFMKTLEQNNIFEGKLSTQEIREKLESNLNAVYVVDKAYREEVKGWYNIASKDIFLVDKDSKNLRTVIENGDNENIDFDKLGTLCHETIHALSSGGFKEENESVIARALNEGITEILAQRMVPSKDRSYDKETEIASTLLAVFGEDLIENYLKSDFDSLKRVATDKQVGREFMQMILQADYRLSLQTNRKSTRDIDESIYESTVNFANKAGINLETLIKYDIRVTQGINEDIIKKAIENYLLNANEGYQEELRQYNDRYGLHCRFGRVFLENIDKKNNGEINFEEYIKHGIVNANEDIIVEHFFNKNGDFKTLCSEINNFAEVLEECERDIAPFLANNLLQNGLEQQYFQENPEKQADYDFKKDVIEEIINQEYGELINTSRDEEGHSKYSWKEMISKMEQFEYYKTDTGIFVVDSRNGDIIALNTQGEIINIEDNLQEKDGDQVKGIKYSLEDKGEQIFLTERDEDGKYILKGYEKDKDNKHIEVDVGVGRNFCDDTTEIDRQLISETNDIKSSSIKNVTEKIKNDLNKDKQVTKENVEEKEKE